MLTAVTLVVLVLIALLLSGWFRFPLAAIDLKLIRTAIIVATVFELYWGVAPRNLAFPHSPEAVQAIRAYQASPSAETKATMLEQLHRNVLHNEHRLQALSGLMLLVDVAAIYFFWNYGIKKSAA
jgi:hypothetical protein